MNLNSGRKVFQPRFFPSATIRSRRPLFAETPPPMVICLIFVSFAARMSYPIRMSMSVFWKLAQRSSLFFSRNSGSFAISSRTKYRSEVLMPLKL